MLLHSLLKRAVQVFVLLCSVFLEFIARVVVANHDVDRIKQTILYILYTIYFFVRIIKV